MRSTTGIRSTKGTKSIKKIVEKLLENRGIKTKKDREEFFSPKNPQDISVGELGISDSQLKKAMTRIFGAIKKKEKIIVYGDYDVDGICATAILWETLDSLGADTLPYIPSRFTEGYGLSREGIENCKLKIENLSLIITVDSGIVANEGVDFANKNGIDVIITDHHQEGKKLPDAYAIVHTTKISGSAVAWVLCRELLNSCQPTAASRQLNNDHLALAAFGTISDVLPLKSFNRSIATWGLRQLRSSPRLGIKALCEEAAVKQDEIDTFHIGFLLGPRINAAGRVEHAMDSLRLLCARNLAKAHELTRKLGLANKLRQEKTESVVTHVQEIHSDGWKDGNLPKLLLVQHESYEEGVIGIAAGRLVDQYHRPAIVVSRGEKFSKASARSITGINILELIKKAGKEFFDNVGGHPMAAGFTVSTEKLEALAQKLLEISELEISDDLLIKTKTFDAEINFTDISADLYSELLRFQPFGFGNLEPTILTKNVSVVDAKTVGKDNTHLKLLLSNVILGTQSEAKRTPESKRSWSSQDDKNVQAKVTLDAIAFRHGGLLEKLSKSKQIEIIYSIDMNEWNGKRNLQLKVKNIKLGAQRV